MPKVSVLIPTYNREGFLSLALESLSKQTSKDFEVVVLDNASVDGTRACVHAFIGRLPKLRYICQPVNIGPVDNIANCMDFAEGDYIKYLMDDDVLEPDCIRVMSRCLDEHPDVALITSKRTPIDQSGNILPDFGPTHQAVDLDTLLTGEELIESVLRLRLNFIGEPSTVMFRKKLVKEPFGVLSGISYRINADIALWFQLLTQGNAIYLIKPLSYFRLHPGQDQRGSDSEIIGSLEWLKLLREMRQRDYLQDRSAYRNVLNTNTPHLQRLLSQLIPELESWRTPLTEQIHWIEEEIQKPSRILLIYPGLVEGFNSYYNGANWFNHGVGMISTLLKQAGFQVTYLDCRKLKDWEEVRKVITETAFDLALISVATVDFDPAQELAKIIKEKDATIKIMVGGAHPTLMLEETSTIRNFDYVFTHEAEVTLPKVIDNLAIYPRIIRGEAPEKLDQLSYVDRSLAPEGETPWFPEFPQPYFSINASRGCLYNCTFCQPAEKEIFGSRVRKRTVDNILDELEYLVREHGMKSFMIHDDCFTQYYAWVEEFCRKKKKRGLNQPFACQSRASIICKRPDLLKTLAEVGLIWVLIGFESGSDRILKFIKKDTTVQQNLEAAEICHALGIKIFANYMFGLPTETEEEMQETALMIQKIQPEHYSPAVFTPAPGSELYAYCKENDLILITSSEGYKRNVNSGAKIKGVDYACVSKMAALSTQAPAKQEAPLHQISIIIPTHNNLNLTQKCLESLAQTLPTPGIETEIIVVDNASNDGTIEFLANLGPKITVINNPTNLGFSKALNQGAELAKEGYLLFLNNDTVVTGDWLKNMLQPLVSDKSIGIVGCKLLFPDESIQHAGVGFTNIPGWLEGVHVYRGYPRYADEVTSPRAMQAVTFACCLVSRKLYFEIGKLDEEYINGLEDMDFCLKVKQAGLKAWYQSTAEVFHLESKTPGRSDHVMHNIALFRRKWEHTGIIEIDTDFSEGKYSWK